jgi:hypothetical protein
MSPILHVIGDIALVLIAILAYALAVWRGEFEDWECW